jgi:anti-sigma factor RsiW
MEQSIFKKNAPQDGCRNEDVSAYLDGELSDSDRIRFESHLENCSQCSAEVREQRTFLRELDIALFEEPAPELPRDFAAVVTAHAQSDMRGVRSSSERRRAIRYSLILALASIVLLGASAHETVFPFLRPVLSVASFVWRAVYEMGAGATIVSRTVGSHLILEASGVGVLLLVLLFAAIALLPRLLSRHHQAEG